ncbi:MAG: hypothetical protein US33_C0006G0009 [Parcubacteria group bacterium GW2011_GWC1_36_9]|nr:MAG: hypothetical protein US33_C0006G0009 [Parcubacteria group bacterium GW2011_GWC1_36_9]
MIKIGDYNKIMSDKKLFQNTVYTTLSGAIKILEERQKDRALKDKIEKILNNNIPEPLKKEGKYGVQFRQIATPNHDVYWFTELTKDRGLKSVFFEYHKDKFTSNNEFKHSLGQLRIHPKINKRGDNVEEKVTIFDFNKYNGKPFKDIMTLWSEPLIDFHRRLFEVCGYSKDNLCFYDASQWFKDNGVKAVSYYTNFILLFICHGILFENFLLTGSEGEFTKKIFLPAFEKAFDLAGIKPLIVPIPPMDNEEDVHWVSYDKKIKPLLKSLNL